MKRFSGVALVASVFVLVGAHHTFATQRAIPGFAFDGSIDTHDIVVPVDDGREPIDQANRATRLHPSLRADTLRLENTPRTGTTSRQIYPSNWWAMVNDGIAARWNSEVKEYSDWATDRENLAPTEKYDLLFYPNQPVQLDEFRAYTLADSRQPAAERGVGILRPAIKVIGPTTAWELTNHGTYQRTYPEAWWGHCNGWAAHVTTEREATPMRDIYVRRDNDKIVECGQNDPSCILFRMADIEALTSEIYFNDTATITGRRCNTPKDKIERDSYGRPIDPACRDLNPATLHLALTGLLGRGAAAFADLNGPKENLPLIMDTVYDEEVWTFPIVGYEIRRAEYITEAQASILVCRGGSQATECSEYPWNENASRFARIEMAVQTVTYETTTEGLRTAPASRPVQPSTSVYNYVLEMDGRGKILGGEWITSPRSAGRNSKEMHPDFLFMGVKSDSTNEEADDRGGSGDNPYISSVNVKELLRLSRTPAATP